MIRTSIAALALLSASSSSFAQTTVQPPISHHTIHHAAFRNAHLHPADRFVRNANDCGGMQSRPVWGHHGTLLGYGCYRNPN
ncbi:MAG: hypothetical protein JO234_04545 [Hyphomicrobiales bacterium]|nr:hypothetical protein [Hyphomicrobiales bacterium]